MATGKTWALEWGSAYPNTFAVRVNLAETYDAALNSSVVSVTSIQVKSTDWKGYTYYPDGVLKIAGTAILTMKSSSGKYKVKVAARDTWYTVTDEDGVAASGSVEITHEADGSASTTVELTGNSYDQLRFFHTGDSSTGGYGWQVTGTQNIELTQIPRASTIGATDANIGSVAMIAVNRKSSAYTHAVMFRFGDVTGYVTEDGGVSSSEVKISAVSIPFKVPDSFYAQIPSAKSGACTLTCKTYSGSTQIGDAQTATFIATAAEALCAPTVSGTVVDSNAATAALTGDASKLVRFMSTALCTISVAAKNSASISQKSIAGTVVSGDTRSIAGVETGSILFQATDSRGYTTKYTASAELIPYIKLTNNAVANRTDPTSGNAVLSLKGACYCGSFGVANNAVTAKYSINGGAEVTVTPVMADGAYSLDIALTGLDYTAQHSIEVTVADKLASVTKTITLKRGIPVFDWGENDFAFNVPVYFNAGYVDKS